MPTNLDVKPDFYSLEIEGMTCASCVSRIEKALNKLPSIEAVSVNLATEQARIRLKHDATLSLEDLLKAIQKTGYKAHLSRPPGTPEKTQRFTWGMSGLTEVLISFALSIPLVVPMFLMLFGFDWSLGPWWQLALATPIQFILGWRFYISGWKSLLSGTGNMDLLIAIGTSSSYGLSVYQLLTQDHAGHSLYFEGSAVIVSMVLLGKWLEARAKKQTTQAIRELHHLWPDNAKVLSAGMGNHPQDLQAYRILPIDQVLPGDRIVVLPGERMPVDGNILFGQSDVDESLMTGESRPVKKTVDDLVIGGSMNGAGVLVLQVQAVGVESVLSKMIALVEEAQTQKAPIQQLVDHISAIFVPSVVGIAIITGIANWWFFDSLPLAILRSVAVLVIACPCALGLATPAAIMAGTGVAARFGILIKDPAILEIAHRIDVVAFDKTGTLTIGRPQLIEIVPLNTNHTLEVMLATAAGLQQGSEHPLAKAIADATQGKKEIAIAASDIRALPGIGIEGKPNSGPWANTLLSLQSLASVQDKPEYAHLLTEHTSPSFTGNTVSILCSNSPNPEFIAAFVFGDAIKHNAKAAIDSLHAMGIRTVLISGDNASAANQVGKLIGIDAVFANVLPSKKAELIAQLQASEQNKTHAVAMIGDGMNDAPALAQADVGMAMSTGTDVAIASAGITLMRGDLALVAMAIDISKRTWNKIRQNLFWAFLFNTAGIPLAAFGYLSPMVSGSAMALSSFLVLSNALLLKKWRP
jgi:Cu+-exporting ATPase